MAEAAPPAEPLYLYLHLYLRMLVPYVLWCHLSDSTHTGVLSEGECEYKVPNTYRIMDTNAVNLVWQPPVSASPSPG